MSRVASLFGKIFSGMFYVHLLRSMKYEQLYIGSTNDLEERILEHNAGKSPPTARYKPWGLMYYEAYSTEKLARLREKQLKFHGNAKRELYKRLGVGKKEKISSAD